MGPSKGQGNQLHIGSILTDDPNSRTSGEDFIVSAKSRLPIAQGEAPNMRASSIGFERLDQPT